MLFTLPISVPHYFVIPVGCRQTSDDDGDNVPRYKILAIGQSVMLGLGYRLRETLRFLALLAPVEGNDAPQTG